MTYANSIRNTMLVALTAALAACVQAPEPPAPPAALEPAPVVVPIEGPVSVGPVVVLPVAGN